MTAQIHPDYIFNWLSGRSVPRESEIGKALVAVEESSKKIADYAINQPREFTYDPRDNKGTIIFVSSPISRVIKAAWDNFYENEIPRPPSKVWNPESGRFVKASGKIGAEIIGSKWSCLQFGKREEKFVPLPHQVGVGSFYSNPRNFKYNRGGLLYWGLETGKTCGSILVLDQIMKTIGDVNKIFVFTTGSLRENFISEYCVKCGLKPEIIQKKFQFITYNYMDVINRLPYAHQMKDSIVIVDEVHILLHGRANGTESYTAIYRLLKRIKRARLILLSGTPIVSKKEELFFLIKLLKPWAFKVRRFEEYYDENEMPSTDLIPIVSDIISYYIPTKNMETGESFYPEATRTNFPVTMSTEQYREYNLARSKEISFLYPPNKDLKVVNPQLYKQKAAIFFLKISMKRSR